MTNPLKAIGDADQRDWTLTAAGDDGDRRVAGAGDIDRIGYSRSNRFEIGHRQLVAERAGRPPADQLGVDDVRPDGLDLANHAASAGQSCRHDQHNRRTADRDADRTEQCSHLVGQESADNALQCRACLTGAPPVMRRHAHAARGATADFHHGPPGVVSALWDSCGRDRAPY